MNQTINDYLADNWGALRKMARQETARFRRAYDGGLRVEADDLIQAAAEALLKQDALPDNPLGFARVTMHNACLRLVRSGKTRRKYDPEIETAYPDVAEGVAEEAVRSSVQGLVLSLLERIDDEARRTAATLFYYRGLTPAEIAEAMGKSTVAVRSLLKRARAEDLSSSAEASLTAYLEAYHPHRTRTTYRAQGEPTELRDLLLATNS